MDENLAFLAILVVILFGFIFQMAWPDGALLSILGL